MGCCCAFLDYDNDGWLDIFLLCGTRFQGAPEGATNRLYHNNGDGTFTDVTAKAGVGRNRTHWGAGCTWIDYDRDGKLDLFVSNYVDFGIGRTPKPGQNENCTFRGVQVNCGPRGLPTGLHSLFHNNGDGTFTDVTEASGIGGIKGHYGLTPVAADFDEDGWPDIFVACDTSSSLLLMNNRDGTFREEGIARGAGLSDDGSRPGWASESAITISTATWTFSRAISPAIPTRYIVTTVWATSMRSR